MSFTFSPYFHVNGTIVNGVMVILIFGSKCNKIWLLVSYLMLGWSSLICIIFDATSAASWKVGEAFKKLIFFCFQTVKWLWPVLSKSWRRILAWSLLCMNIHWADLGLRNPSLDVIIRIFQWKTRSHSLALALFEENCYLWFQLFWLPLCFLKVGEVALPLIINNSYKEIGRWRIPKREISFTDIS